MFSFFEPGCFLKEIISKRKWGIVWWIWSLMLCSLHTPSLCVGPHANPPLLLYVAHRHNLHIWEWMPIPTLPCFSSALFQFSQGRVRNLPVYLWTETISFEDLQMVLTEAPLTSLLSEQMQALVFVTTAVTEKCQVQHLQKVEVYLACGSGGVEHPGTWYWYYSTSGKGLLAAW